LLNQLFFNTFFARLYCQCYNLVCTIRNGIFAFDPSLLAANYYQIMQQSHKQYQQQQQATVVRLFKPEETTQLLVSQDALATVFHYIPFYEMCHSVSRVCKKFYKAYKYACGSATYWQGQLEGFTSITLSHNTDFIKSIVVATEDLSQQQQHQETATIAIATKEEVAFKRLYKMLNIAKKMKTNELGEHYQQREDVDSTTSYVFKFIVNEEMAKEAVAAFLAREKQQGKDIDALYEGLTEKQRDDKILLQQLEYTLKAMVCRMFFDSFLALVVSVDYETLPMYQNKPNVTLLMCTGVVTVENACYSQPEDVEAFSESMNMSIATLEECKLDSNIAEQNKQTLNSLSDLGKLSLIRVYFPQLLHMANIFGYIEEENKRVKGDDTIYSMHTGVLLGGLGAMRIDPPSRAPNTVMAFINMLMVIPKLHSVDIHSPKTTLMFDFGSKGYYELMHRFAVTF